MLLLPITLSAVLAQTGGAGTEVTVYNQGYGFVKEVRALALKAGRQAISIENVAAQIEPNSVGIRSFTPAVPFEVIEQNYRYDLISVQAILSKSVGGRVRFHRVLPNGQKETVSGTLLNAPNRVTPGSFGDVFGGMVIRTDEGKILLNPTGEIEVESIPAGLISTPTLVWDLEADKAGTANVEISYLTQGMAWNADYVLTLDDKTKKAALRGWVTVNNTSGVTFKDAKLKLLAGDVARQQPPQAPTGGFGGGGFDMAAMKRGVSEQTLSEYHLYTVERPTTIQNNEMKQISMLEGSGVPYTKKIVVDSMLNFGMYRPSEGQIGVGDIKPIVKLEFENTKANGLGMPLPKGNVKAYQADSTGSLQMIGEDAIDHTPRDEKVSLTIGRAFDVRATRTRTNFRWISPSKSEETFEIEVRNRKEEPESVTVLERHYYQWEIPSSNEPWKKADSETQVYVLNLKAGETRTIKYTVINWW